MSVTAVEPGKKPPRLSRLTEAFALMWFNNPTWTASRVLRAVNPRTRAWTVGAVNTAAYNLKKRSETFLAKLRDDAAAANVISVARRKEMLSTAAEQAYKGVGQFVDVTQDGETRVKLTRENRRSPALKRITGRRTVRRDKDGAETVSYHHEVEVHDFKGYVEELNRMEGVGRESDQARGGGVSIVLNFGPAPAPAAVEAPAVDVESEDIPESGA